MIPRTATAIVVNALADQAAVALIGPRQSGKTTLALALAETVPSVYLDLALKADRDKLAEHGLYLQSHADKLVILDEIHHLPGLFQMLRKLIDQEQSEARRSGRFLVLGSASIDLLRQSGESLAGRIEYIELGALGVLEVAGDGKARDRLWLRGGFPDSYLAQDDSGSFLQRRSFIKTCLERDVPQFGRRIRTETLERLWTMLARHQGTQINALRLASRLSVSATMVTDYIGLLVDLMLVQQLPPYHVYGGKRRVKSPRTYIRDSGLLHGLLGIGDMEALLAHPVGRASWKYFVIESLLTAAPEQTQASFYATAAGAEIDLVLELGGGAGTWAIEIKHQVAAGPQRGFHHALAGLEPDRSFVVHAGGERHALGNDIEAISLRDMARELAALA